MVATTFQLRVDYMYIIPRTRQDFAKTCVLVVPRFKGLENWFIN